VRVRAEQRLSGDAESLLVDGMGDAVAGGRIPDAPLLAGALEEEVVVGILVVFLDQVVIHVLGREVALGPLDVHCFEFEHHHRAGGVLGQRLVDVEGDLLAWFHLPFDEVVVDELLRDGSGHGLAPRRAHALLFR
jgi:hypothetical protein